MSCTPNDATWKGVQCTSALTLLKHMCLFAIVFPIFSVCTYLETPLAPRTKSLCRYYNSCKVLDSYYPVIRYPSRNLGPCCKACLCNLIHARSCMHASTHLCMHGCLIAEARGNQRHAFQLNATVAEDGFADWITYSILRYTPRVLETPYARNSFCC